MCFKFIFGPTKEFLVKFQILCKIATNFSMHIFKSVHAVSVQFSFIFIVVNRLDMFITGAIGNCTKFDSLVQIALIYYFLLFKSSNGIVVFFCRVLIQKLSFLSFSVP